MHGIAGIVKHAAAAMDVFGMLAAFDCLVYLYLSMHIRPNLVSQL